MVLEPAQPRWRGDRGPIATPPVLRFGQPLRDHGSSLGAGPGIDVGAGPDLPALFVVEDEALAHAGSGDSGDIRRSHARARQNLLDAGRHLSPTIGGIEIKSA